jgi:hypothetical protein
MHPSKVPEGEECAAYATDLQPDSKRKQFIYYITIKTQLPFADFKQRNVHQMAYLKKTQLPFTDFKQCNVHQMAYLKKNHIWMTRHSLTSRQVTRVGFLYADLSGHSQY